MNEQNQKPEWFTLADEDKAATHSQLKKSAKISLLLFPLAVVLTGFAYANLHQESAANADSPVISQTTVAPVVITNSAPAATPTKVAPMNPIAKAPRAHGREGGEGRENHEGGEGED